MKECFEATPVKGRVNIVAQSLYSDCPCECALSLEQYVTLVKQYQKVSAVNYTVFKLQSFIKDHYGALCKGSKEKLQRIAMMGIVEYATM
jgi:hypothetical protein